MLINFSFSNFKSYRDEQQFSLQRPQNAQKHEGFDWHRRDISTIAGIYGGNASGKSAFIDAFRFLADFVVNGFSPNFDFENSLSPFKLDSTSRQKPSNFLVEFIGSDSARYTYELSLGPTQVEYEALRTYSGNRSSRVFERELTEGGYTYKYGRTFTGAKKTFERMTRPEVPFVTVLYVANSPFAKPVYELFQSRVGFFEADLYDCELRNLQKELAKGSPIAHTLADLMASANLGVSVVQKRDVLDDLQKSSQQPGNPQEGAYRDLASGLLALSQPDMPREERLRQAQSIAGQNPNPALEFSFTHRGANGFEEVFSEGEESRGTLAVLAFFSLALRLLSRQSVGFIDEIDSSLHPAYVQELVGLFKDPRTNPHQSQLIFTTHDVSLITRTGADRRVLDQDQIWLVEKGGDGSSTIYPVTSISTRWDENFGRNYLHGVYGAAPRPNIHGAFAHAVETIGDFGADYTANDYGGGN